MNTKTTLPRMHVGLYVSSIDDTKNFYERFFDKAPTKVKDNYVKFELESPALIISFIVDKGKVNNNFGHLGIQVDNKEELDSKFAAIKEAGLDYLEENQVSCCYALQDKFWVNDPDGIRWEVYQFHEDVEINDSHDSAACCQDDNKDKKESCREPEAQCC